VQRIDLLLCTLLFALSVQIGTNFANDYFDFLKKADTQERIGPLRAVQQGWVLPSTMLQATKIAFGFAVVFALPLLWKAPLWSLAVVPLAILFGILYTGGPKPLGYLGLGDILVFLFFGPIATCGTNYLQTGAFHADVLIASIAPGLFATALLVANNLRDAKTDVKANKNTLVVRFGPLFGRLEYTLCLSVPCFIPILLILQYKAPVQLLSAACLLPIAAQLIRKVWSAKEDRDYIPLLGGAAFLYICYTVLFTLGTLSYTGSG
jgi:1,4-dihydroxy-2-naphthoate octaprenyltransferase